MKDEEINDLVESANEKLKEDAEDISEAEQDLLDGEFDDADGGGEDGTDDGREGSETLKATPLVRTKNGTYTGTIGSAMSINITISGGFQSGKVGAANHLIESIVERFGDDRPIQVDYTVGETVMHSKKYNQTITQSRAYAPILTVNITENN